MFHDKKSPTLRLVSLDVFREITITALILINIAEVADQVYSFLLHTD